MRAFLGYLHSSRSRSCCGLALGASPLGTALPTLMSTLLFVLAFGNSHAITQEAPATTGEDSPQIQETRTVDPIPAAPVVVDPRSTQLRDISLDLIEAARPYRELLADVVVEAYSNSGFRPIWNGDDLPGDLHIELSKELADHAFPPLFSLDPILLSTEIQNRKCPVDSRDLSYTIALLDSGLLCRAGAVTPSTLWPDWNYDDTPGSQNLSSQSLAGDLIQATAIRPFDVQKVIATLGPKNWIYRELQKQYPAYRKAILKHSGLPSIPDPATSGVARPGEAYPYAPAIAAHLADRGYYEEPAEGFSSLSHLSTELTTALMTFQRDCGLDADGIFGPASWRFLNSNAADRYRSLSINLHRARLLPDDMGDRYALVNLPCAELYLFEKGDFHVDTMRVVHGKASKETHHTPVFRDVMQEVVFGPYWNVPKSIAVKEVLPKAQADWGYLSRNRYEIVSDFNPYNKNTHRLSPQNLELVEQGRLLLRQKPGPSNALGHVKFLFPNSFNVYMHDTPSRNLFARVNRDLSHGCIRVSKPERLGEWVLQPEGWTQESVKAAMEGDARKSIALKEEIPVYIVYLTLFTRPTSGGKIILAPGRDVYERDPIDSKALSAAIPWNQSERAAAPSTEAESSSPAQDTPAVTVP